MKPGGMIKDNSDGPGKVLDREDRSFEMIVDEEQGSEIITDRKDEPVEMISDKVNGSYSWKVPTIHWIHNYNPKFPLYTSDSILWFGIPLIYV